MSTAFGRFARAASRAAGNPLTFALAVLLVLTWALTGPIFGFSDSWQLVINTGTTIATFLTVFLIQNTQNRDAAAMHTKLDELLHAVRGAHDSLIQLEEQSDEELAVEHERLRQVAEQSRTNGGVATSGPEPITPRGAAASRSRGSDGPADTPART